MRKPKINRRIKCKNCGFEFNGNFCNNCGQDAKAGKLDSPHPRREFGAPTRSKLEASDDYAHSLRLQ